jgi:hypothetical protein
VPEKIDRATTLHEQGAKQASTRHSARVESSCAWRKRKEVLPVEEDDS